MRVVVRSDTHTLHGQVAVPDGDMLVHCGDFTGTGRISEIAGFGLWMRGQPHRHKVVVAGNHDIMFERNRGLALALLQNGLGDEGGGGIVYLEDSGAEIGGLKIYGSPHQPRFMDWAFNHDRGEDIRRYWDLIPDGLDLLVTHGPPKGILDQTHPLHGSEHLGCEELLGAVERAKPRHHVFGHIHGGYGASWHVDTVFYNASVCDEAYNPRNAPLVIDL